MERLVGRAHSSTQGRREPLGVGPEQVVLVVGERDETRPAHLAQVEQVRQPSDATEVGEGDVLRPANELIAVLAADDVKVVLESPSGPSMHRIGGSEQN